MYKNNLFSIREDVSTMLLNKGQPAMTQERLAKLCGVSRQAIWAIESEESMPSYPLALRVFVALRQVDPKIVLTDLFPVPKRKRKADHKTSEKQDDSVRQNL